jgi:hypothetical protein
MAKRHLLPRDHGARGFELPSLRPVDSAQSIVD